jgi:hypothetical protein
MSTVELYKVEEHTHREESITESRNKLESL